MLYTLPEIPFSANKINALAPSRTSTKSRDEVKLPTFITGFVILILLKLIGEQNSEGQLQVDDRDPHE